MTESKDQYLLDKYYILNMGDYSQPGSELCEILHRLDENGVLDEIDKDWIKSKGMFKFFEFLKKWEESGKPNFDLLKERKLANDAIHIGEKYGIYIRHPKSILSKILQRIAKGNRFSKRDVIWLIEKEYLKGELKLEYHRREAVFYLDNLAIDKSLWNIVNASSHFRKAHLSNKSIEITENINFKKIKNKHLKSALSITRGGEFRDIQQFEEGLKYAQKGYSFDSSSFHPCTLFGAIYYEMQNFLLGDKWFERAVENGAEVNNIDSELRSIFKRTKGKERDKLKEHLLKTDPYRYSWVNKKT